MAKITYADKVGLPGYPKTNHINQFWDDDANEIKTVVNGLDDSVTSLEDTTQSLITDGIKTGGIVTWKSGLTFNVSACEYIINGTFYNTAATEVTLSTADPTNPRIDIIIVDTTQLVTAITGTPGATPQKPTANPTTQIELTSVLIPASATSPGGITETIVYDENTEWTGSVVGATANFASTGTAYNGTIAADITNRSINDYIEFTNTTNIPIDIETISFFVYQKTQTQFQRWMTVMLVKDGSPVSNFLIYELETTAGIWQNVSFNAKILDLSDTEYDAVRISWLGNTDSDIFLDYVKVQRGINQAISNAIWEKSADLVYPQYTTDKVLIGKKTSSGDYDLQVNEFIHINGTINNPDVPTSGGVLWVDSDASNNLHYRDGSTVINITANGKTTAYTGTTTTNISPDADDNGKVKINDIGASIEIRLDSLQPNSSGVILIGHSTTTAYTVTIYGNTTGTGNTYTALTTAGSGQIALTTSGAGYYDLIKWEWLPTLLTATHTVIH